MADALHTLPFDAEAAKSARRYFISRLVIYGLLIVFAAVYMLPLFVVVFNSFRDLPEIAQNGLIAFPRSFGFKAWHDAWSTYCINGTCEGMRGNFFNSLWMTVPATIISTLLGALNGYILSKWRFRGSEILFTCMLFGVFMPGQIALDRLHPTPGRRIIGCSAQSGERVAVALECRDPHLGCQREGNRPATGIKLGHPRPRIQFRRQVPRI